MKTPPISPTGSICGAMLMKTFIEHLVGIEDVECAATYRAAVKGWQSGHYVAPGLAVNHSDGVMISRHAVDGSLRCERTRAMPSSAASNDPNVAPR